MAGLQLKIEEIRKSLSVTRRDSGVCDAVRIWFNFEFCPGFRAIAATVYCNAKIFASKMLTICSVHNAGVLVYSESNIIVAKSLLSDFAAERAMLVNRRKGKSPMLVSYSPCSRQHGLTPYIATVINTAVATALLSSGSSSMPMTIW